MAYVIGNLVSIFGDLLNIAPASEKTNRKKYIVQCVGHKPPEISKTTLSHQIASELHSQWLEVGGYLRHAVEIEKKKCKSIR